MNIACKIFLIFIIPLIVHASTNDLNDALSQLETLDAITGDSVSVNGNPGKFYLLSKTFIANGSITNFTNMALSTNPIVRVMGAYCFIKTKKTKLPNEIFFRLLRDNATVEFMPFGCLVEHRTISYIVGKLIDDPYTLEQGAIWKKKAKKK